MKRLFIIVIIIAVILGVAITGAKITGLFGKKGSLEKECLQRS